MGYYNFNPLKRCFVPETSPKDRKERDYTYDSQYQAVYSPEVLFIHSIPLYLATKPDDSRFLKDSIS